MIWQEISNMFLKGESIGVSHNTLLGRCIFMYHLKNQMVQLHLWLHSTFKELSNDTSHTKILVKTKKLWPEKSEKNKFVTTKKTVCHDEKNSLSRQFFFFIATNCFFFFDFSGS